MIELQKAQTAFNFYLAGREHFTFGLCPFCAYRKCPGCDCPCHR